MTKTKITPTHDAAVIEMIWTLMALARTDFWSGDTLARAEALYAEKVDAPHNAAKLRALMEQARKKAADELGVPPWNG